MVFTVEVEFENVLIGLVHAVSVLLFVHCSQRQRLNCNCLYGEGRVEAV